MQYIQGQLKMQEWKIKVIEAETAKVVISMTLCEWLFHPAFGCQTSINVRLFNKADFRDPAGSLRTLCRASVDYKKEHPTREAERTRDNAKLSSVACQLDVPRTAKT